MGWPSATGVVIVALSGTCSSTSPSSVTPTSAPATSPPPSETSPEPDSAATQGELDATVAPEPAEFTITVSSLCPEPWQASLVRRDKEEPRSGSGRFEATKAARSLRMRPGDSLVLTNENGGIMAIDFEDVTTDQVVVVEIAKDCSGVSRTITRGGSGR